MNAVSYLRKCQEAFVNIFKNVLHYPRVRVILSNETCDLDSGICSVTLSYMQSCQATSSSPIVLPLLNIQPEDLILKTELLAFMKLLEIPSDLLPTRGERDVLHKLHDAGILELVLVDHHDLSQADEVLESAVVEVIDHRPPHPRWLWKGKESVAVTLENAGSCASLIALHAKDSPSPQCLTKEIAKMLLGAILLDTTDMKGRFTEKDTEAFAYLNAIAQFDTTDLFRYLIKSKSDIGGLSTSQVLMKDLKVMGGVPIAGCPVLIETLIKRDDFQSSLNDFVKKMNDIPLVILMGVVIVTGEAELKTLRDIAFYGKLKDVIAEILEKLESCNLNLEEVCTHSIPNLTLYRQGNVKVTRKEIGAVVRQVTSNCDVIINCGLG